MTTATGLPLEEQDASPLVLNGPNIVTRGQLKSRCDALYAALHAEGVKRVLVCSDDPVDILRSIDASNRNGSDLWIAHTNIPAAYLEEIIRQFSIQMIISGNGETRTAEAGDDLPAAGRIYLMTSGTTGRPKIVTHTLDSLLSRIRGSAKLPVNRDGRWLLTYQPTGFAGLQVIFTTLLSMGVIVVPEHRTPVGFYEAASQHNVTQISGTPTFWRSFLLVVAPGALPLRQITLGGEAVDQPTLDRVRTAFPDARVTHIYASTEAGVVFAVHDGLDGFPAEWLEKPIHGTQLRIRDGVLQVKTANAMQGYRMGSIEPSTEDGWLTTGDLVEMTDGRVHFLGRQDAIINVGGSKVYPQTVEAFLLAMTGVREARVCGVPNPVSGFLVKADVVLADGMDGIEARKRILTECHKRLPAYQVPRVLKVVDSIPLAVSGKKA
jgi:acyl-coenzyme A synthetase/AMP-(fatty) acid ligase